jgi:hypothetical protein
VARSTIEVPAARLSEMFLLDGFARDWLLSGWYDIGLTFRHLGGIATCEIGRAPWMADL